MRKRQFWILLLLALLYINCHANERARDTLPEIIILDQIPKQKYPLSVSGSYPVYVEEFEKPVPSSPQKPSFTIENPFRRSNLYRSSFYRVDNGWLVALDAGEWGSWFGWYSETGETHYKISGARIFEFSRIHGHLYVYGGGCGGNRGKYGFVAKLGLDSGVWVFDFFESFPDCVMTITETREFGQEEEYCYFVLTSTLIYKWSPKNGKELLHGHLGWHDPERGSWSNLKPNSIARDLYENFFIGTDLGIIAILSNRGNMELPMGLEEPPTAPSNADHKPTSGTETIPNGSFFDKLFEEENSE